MRRQEVSGRWLGGVPMRGDGRRRAWVFAMVVGLVIPAISATADELDRYLATIQRQIDDTSRPVAERKRLALEAAGALDRAAQDGRDAPAARAAWERASGILEAFAGRLEAAAAGEGEGESANALRLQAAIYRWAQARTLFVVAALDPANPDAREAAASGLEVAIAALRPLVAAEEARVSVEARYRLAQALADRAGLEAEAQACSATRTEALGLLRGSWDAVPGLGGHALRLRSELLLEQGRPEDALEALRSAPKGAEPRVSLIGLQARALAALGRLGEGRELVAEALAAGADRDEVLLDVLLSGVAGARNDKEREAIAHEALERVSRRTGSAGRLSRITAAKVIPTLKQGLTAVDREVLAEGLLLLGRAAAAAGELDAGSGSATSGDERGRLRYQGALAWREAGDPSASRRGFEAILSDPEAQAWHAQAALALALGRPGVAVDRADLGDVIARYPDDPAADEARMLLGWELVGQYRDEEALRAWEGVARGRPRHSDALIARIELLLEDLETALASEAGNSEAIRERLVSLLDTNSRLEPEQTVQRSIKFARLCLELVDWMIWRERAEQDLEKALRLPMRRIERERLEILDTAVRIRAGRHAEGERLSRERFGTFGIASLLEGGERLERIACASTLDVERRRFGTLCGEASGAVLRREGVGHRDHFRAVLLASRAADLRGDRPGALSALEELKVEPSALSPRDRLALAETRRRAGQAARALVDYDSLAQAGAPGSPLWLAARLGMSRCHLDDGRPERARQVLEATAVLAPELGGDAFRGQFETLRRRLEARRR